MDNHDKLVLMAKRKLPFIETLGEVMDDYSHRISEAVMPVSAITAPVVAALLTQYAESIKQLYPEMEEQMQRILQLPRQEIRVDIPRGNGRGRV